MNDLENQGVVDPTEETQVDPGILEEEEEQRDNPILTEGEEQKEEPRFRRSNRILVPRW